MTLRIFHCLAAMLLTALAVTSGAAQTPQKLRYEILREEAHDPSLFTQGLLVQDELLVETAGGYGQSLIRRYRADTGAMVNQALLPSQVFGEGVAQVDEQLFVLTWRKGICYVINARTLEFSKQFQYRGEGWGLTYNGHHLIMSDGSNQLTLRHPSDFSEVRRITVTDPGHTWSNLNELEYAKGLVWANVWQDQVILAINPRTGVVQGILDLSELVERNSTRPNHSVLNGIAYNRERQAFWVTGKLWPRRYLLKIIWSTDSSDRNQER